MTTEDVALTAISSWTDDEIRADDVRAAGVLYAAATLEDLKLIELAERLNELNQNKMLSIGAGQASNLLHHFWDAAYKRMPPKRRVATFARVVGMGDAPDDAESNDAFEALLEQLVEAIAEGPADAVGPAAADLRANLAEHTDESTTKAAVELRATYTELVDVLSDLELRSAFRAGDMWELVEKVVQDWGSDAPDVSRPLTLATAGATILRALPALCDDPTPSDEVVAAAKQWLPANSPAA